MRRDLPVTTRTADHATSVGASELVTTERFVRYSKMNNLPANSEATENEGGLHRSILESSDLGFCTIEVVFDENEKPLDYRFLEVSSSFERQTGIKNAAGRWMREIAPAHDQFWFDIYGRVALTGEPERFENFSTPLGRWWSVHAFKIAGAGRVALLFHDITDRKRAEAALHTSEARFRGFANASADIVYRMSPDWSEMRQLDGQGFVGDTPDPSEKWMDRYIPPEDRGTLQEAIDRAIGTKSQFNLEHRVMRVDGTPGWTKSRAIPMLGEQGEITEWLGTASDITLARAEREALDHSEERYRTLFEAIDTGFCVVEMIFGDDGRATDYRFVETNPAFERQSGVVGAVGRRVRELVPDLEEHWFERYGRVALTGEPMHVEGEAASLGRWFDITAFRVGVPEQRRVAVLFTDISARRIAEENLRESEVKYRTLFETMTEGYGICELIRDDEGQAVDWRHLELNPALERHTGMDRTASIGRLTSELFPGADRSYWLGIYQAVVDTGSAQAFENYWPPIDRWFGGMASPAGGNRFYITYRDVTEEKRAEFALRESEARQAFLLKLSDALRPLGDPMEVQTAAARVLGEHLKVNRAFFAEVDVARDQYVVNRTYANGAAPFTGHFRLSDIRWTAELAGSGQNVVFDDVSADVRLSEAERAFFAAMEIAAGIGVPLIKDGRWVAGLGVHHATPRQWTSEDIDLVRETAERTWAAVQRAQAETELRESERHQALLLAELQHRVRNILTIVRSVVRRTADNCEDVDDYVRHLDGRLAALSRIQTILTRDPGQGVDLHDMVLNELGGQSASPAHYQIEGPKVELSAKAAEVLSLAVHELATNSTKYGVLSASSGTIRIRWTVDDHGGQAWLRWTWHEPVVSTIDRPARSGFGTELIKRRVPYELRGTGHLLIGAEGVEARIDFPLANEQGKLGIGATDRNMRQ